MAGPKKRALVWERDEPRRRPAPAPLSRERIVVAAITLADAEGLAAVSLRNVGAALDAGPMRLYGYVDTKDELLDLMVDAVHAEVVGAVKTDGDWRDVLASVAHATRAVARAHPWVVELLGGRQRIGPNALTRMEIALGAFRGVAGFEDIDLVVQAVGTVDAFVVGAVQSEVNEARAERESGLDERAWHGATWPYLERLIATGRYEMIGRVVHDARHPPAEIAFERGLGFVLDGIAASVTRGSTR